MKLFVLLFLGVGVFAIYELVRGMPTSVSQTQAARQEAFPTTGQVMISPSPGLGIANGISTSLSALGQMFSGPLSNLPLTSGQSFDLSTQMPGS